MSDIVISGSSSSDDEIEVVLDQDLAGIKASCVVAKVAAEEAQGLAEIAQSNAETAEGNAEAYRDQALSYASSASSSADSASTSEDNAETYALNASDSANTATTQAGIATTKASEASAGASTATSQAIIATQKASEASVSASNAATSESNANTHEAQSFANRTTTADLLARFRRYYRGEYLTSNLPTDSEDGALAWDLTDEAMKVWNGSSWEFVSPTTTNFYDKDETDTLLDLKQDILSEGAFADGDKTKLDNVPANTNSELALKQDILAEGSFVDGDKTKLDGIETGATADQTGAEIKSLYEAEDNTNVYTDAEKNGTATQTLTNKTLDDYTNKIKANAVHMRVKNQSGVVMPKGTVVSYFGYSDTEDAVKVLKANNTTGVAIGILAEDLGVDSFGMAIANGIIDGLDTSSYANGTILYTNTTGGLTNIAPTTGFAQPIAYVLKSNATIGVLQVLAAYPKQDASDVRYNNATSGLAANEVNSAIDELKNTINSFNTAVEW